MAGFGNSQKQHRRLRLGPLFAGIDADSTATLRRETTLGKKSRPLYVLIVDERNTFSAENEPRGQALKSSLLVEADSPFVAHGAAGYVVATSSHRYG